MARQLGYKSITGLVDQVPSNSGELSDGIAHCAQCGRVIDGCYAMVNSEIACVSCVAVGGDPGRRTGSPIAPRPSLSGANVAGAITPGESTGFVQALLFGTGAAVLGLVLFATFTIVTHLYLGYVALAVGWLVGKAMMQGSGGVGGPRYQIAAVMLTYAAISLASIAIQISEAASGGSAINWASMGVPMLFDGIISPFLELRRGTFGIIGLVILFVGLRVAFQITREKQPKALPH